MRKLIIFIVALSASCVYYPECGDKDVLETVLQVCVDEVTFELAYEKFYEEEISEFDTYEGALTMEMLTVLSMMEGGGIDFEQVINKAKVKAKKELRKIIVGADDYDEDMKKYVAFAQRIISESEMDIINIRTVNVEPELEKCYCRADLSIVSDRLKNVEIPIRYTAQYTVDDVLYVEVDF